MPTVLVRNKEKGPTVFSDLGENIQIEWFGAGDQEGRDVQRVPDKLMDNTDFLRTLDRGILEVVEATPEMQEKIDQQAAFIRAQREQAQKNIEDSIDRQTERSLVDAQINEKGEIVSQVQTEAQPASGSGDELPSTVQMDEDGRILESIPEPTVVIEQPQRG